MGGLSRHQNISDECQNTSPTLLNIPGGKRLSKLNTTEDMPLCQWEREKENTSKNKKI